MNSLESQHHRAAVDADHTLVVEDSISVAETLRGWLTRNGPTVVMHAVDYVDASQITGRDFVQGGKVSIDPVSVCRAFLDYEFIGRVSAEEVLQVLIEGGVSDVTAISSSEIYNLRLKSRGATRCITKSELLRQVERALAHYPDAPLPDL